MNTPATQQCFVSGFKKAKKSTIIKVCKLSKTFYNFNPLTHMSKRILILPIKRQWLDMIRAGVKMEEYREIKPYWNDRLLKNGAQLGDKNFAPEFQKYDTVLFRNGYSDKAPTFEVECKGIEIKNANPAWCNGDTSVYYAIKLGNPIIHNQSLQNGNS